MNALTKEFLEEYHPYLALICYKTENDNRNYYIDAHPIDKYGEMLEGKPLQQETISGMIETFYDENAGKIKMGGIIPDTLLSYQLLSGGDYKLVWYQPEQQRGIFFSNSLHLPSGKAWVPAMLYVATRRSLKVYALESNDRPQLDSKLFRAPFHNTSGGDGAVCLGSAKAEKPTDQQFTSFIKYWEQMFWASEFTHLSGTNPTKTNLNMLWKKLIENDRLKWSELDELIPCIDSWKNPVTLKRIINENA